MAVARKSRAGIITLGRVPTLPVEVDWSHPLAAGLIACYVPGGARGLVDLATYGPILTRGSGSVIGASSTGAALINKVASAGASSTAVPSAWKLTNAGTVFFRADWYGVPGVQNALLWGISLTTDVSPFNHYVLQIIKSTGLANFGYNAAGTGFAVTSSIPAPTSGSHSIAATFVMGGGATALYQDAVLVGSGTWSGGAPTYSNPVSALGVNPAQPSRITNTGITTALTYNRALSASEIAILDKDPFCMLRPLRRAVFSGSTPLALASRGSARAQGHGALFLSQALTSHGAGYSHGKGALSLAQALTSRGAGYSRGQGTLSLAQPLTARGAAFSHGKDVLSLAQPLTARGAAFSRGQGTLSLAQALTSRGAAFSRGRGALTMLLSLPLTSLGSARSTGRNGPFILSLALVSQGSSFSRGRGVLTVDGTPLAFVSRGSAFSHGRDTLTLPIIVPLHSRGQAFAHGGMVRGGQQGTGVLTLKPFVPFQNVVEIGFPQRGYPMVDPQTGLINETWYRFMQSVWLRGGGTTGT